MPNLGVWFGSSETQGADVAAASRWRDAALLPVARALPGVDRIERYCAFNVSRCVVVANRSDPNPVAMPVVAPAGVTSLQLSARQCALFRQPGVADPIAAAPILYSVLFKIPPDWHAEFDAWYDTDHMPIILGCKRWAMTARYHVIGSPYTHLALHYIECASAFDDAALKAARQTPWRNKLLAHRWFTDVDKMIYFKQSGA